MNIHSILTITHSLGRGLEIGSYTLRIYQLMFLAAFICGFYIIKWIFKRENAPEAWIDSLLTYVVVATVIGARLGHVFFYQWDYYKNNVGEILQVWKGGLASHGAAIAIIIALIFYSRKITKRHPYWILDRVVIVVALAAAFIRFGNYTNSEIYGKISNSSIETVFVVPAQDYLTNVYPSSIYDVNFEETGEVFATDSIQYPVYNARISVQSGKDPKVVGRKLQNEILPRLAYRNRDDRNILAKPGAVYSLDKAEAGVVNIEVLGVPRIPSQWIEGIGYFFIFIILFMIYLKTNRKDYQGFLLGMFLILLFGFRFFVEYLKADQVDFESTMALNMGQILSIPLVIAGLILVLTSGKRIKVYGSTEKSNETNVA